MGNEDKTSTVGKLEEQRALKRELEAKRRELREYERRLEELQRRIDEQRQLRANLQAQRYHQERQTQPVAGG